MQIDSNAEVRFKLALDILSDIISKHLTKQASSDLREATLAIMEKETEDHLDFEMTSELLGTPDFRILSVA